MRVVLAIGSTDTGRIQGLSAAGSGPDRLVHTPAADAEIVTFGTTVRSPVVPISPTGCPTPAVVTRAVRELVGFDLLMVDAGLAVPTAAPTVEIHASMGDDIREPVPVANASDVVATARDLGRRLPDDALLIGESIPGGTTSALGVLAALGEPFGVSSSLPENPIDRKHSVVETGLTASDIDRGAAEGNPVRALRTMGDPVLATVTGITQGAIESGTTVTLAGGTQFVAAAALIRHAGVEGPLGLATTTYVVADDGVDLWAAADAFDLDLTITDPGFEQANHGALERYSAGEGKEGVGMGGVLKLAAESGVPMHRVRERVIEVYGALTDSREADHES